MDETRRTLHSCHVHHLCTKLQDIFPSGTLSQLLHCFSNLYTILYPEYQQPLNHPFYDLLTPIQQNEWQHASRVLDTIINRLDHPAGVVLPEHSPYNLRISINALCSTYLQTQANSLQETFWDLINTEYNVFVRALGDIIVVLF